MTPDALLQAFRQILEDVAPEEIKRRVEGAEISDQQWMEIEARLHLMRLMNMNQEVAHGTEERSRFAAND